MYHLDKHDRAVLELALDTAMVSVVNAIEDTPMVDIQAIDGYIFMLTEFKRISEKLHNFLTALENQDELSRVRKANQRAGVDDCNIGSGKPPAARKKPAAGGGA